MSKMYVYRNYLKEIIIKDVNFINQYGKEKDVKYIDVYSLILACKEIVFKIWIYDPQIIR